MRVGKTPHAGCCWGVPLQHRAEGRSRAGGSSCHPMCGGAKYGEGAQHGGGRRAFPTAPLRWLPGISSTSRLPEPVMPRDHGPRALPQPAPVAPGWLQSQHCIPACGTRQSEPTAETPKGQPWASSAPGAGVPAPCSPPVQGMQPLQALGLCSVSGCREHPACEGRGSPRTLAAQLIFGPSGPVILTNPFLAQTCAGKAAPGHT